MISMMLFMKRISSSSATSATNLLRQLKLHKICQNDGCTEKEIVIEVGDPLLPLQRHVYIGH